jgi:nucleoside-diphosphate kinase
MSIERTLGIIKPNAVQNRNVGEIVSAVEGAGFTIRGLKMTRLSSQIIRGFYAEHVSKPFFPELEEFMSEGPLVLMVLEGEDAIHHWRELMGATDPAKAAPGTLRKKYADSVTRNAVHGSDSPASADREVHYFFSAFDMV